MVRCAMTLGVCGVTFRAALLLVQIDGSATGRRRPWAYLRGWLQRKGLRFLSGSACIKWIMALLRVDDSHCVSHAGREEAYDPPHVPCENWWSIEAECVAWINNSLYACL